MNHRQQETCLSGGSSPRQAGFFFGSPLHTAVWSSTRDPVGPERPEEGLRPRALVLSVARTEKPRPCMGRDWTELGTHGHFSMEPALRVRGAPASPLLLRADSELGFVARPAP